MLVLYFKVPYAVDVLFMHIPSVDGNPLIGLVWVRAGSEAFTFCSCTSVLSLCPLALSSDSSVLCGSSVKPSTVPCE